MELPKKKRAQNWSPEEKEILRQLIADKAGIIEYKSTKTTASIEKNKEWKVIAKRFNEMTNGTRTDVELKLAWKRMKLAAKANLSAHRQEVMKTGGGGKPPSPSLEDQAIMSIAPHDFIVEVSDCDSDRVVVIDEEPVAGPSQEVPLPVVGLAQVPPAQELPDKIDVVAEEHEIPPQQQYSKKNKGKGKGKKTLKCPDFRQKIVEGNIDFKKQHLSMLQEEHELNMKIGKLKIRKLELEVAVLESQAKMFQAED